MEYLVANVNDVRFDIEVALDEQIGAMDLPFTGMDKSTAAVCQFFITDQGCEKGMACPFRHVRGDRTVVCKHWLRGLCKKGDQCEFLHEYDMSKMPECYFYSRFNACHNKECPFLHIDPESKIKDCPWYDRGFCRHGPHCRHRHVRRVLCTNYLAGFCPDGATCKYKHPQFELPQAQPDVKDWKKTSVIVCHHCREVGHKITYCYKLAPELREEYIRKGEEKYQMHLKRFGHNVAMPNPGANDPGAESNQPANGNATEFKQFRPLKPLEEVTCFKCGNKGHYANRCTKGHLAFLSKASHPY